MEENHLASLVKKARLKAGLTQGQTARKVGVSENYISGMENGNCFSLLARFYALAIVLNIPPIRLIEAAWLDINGVPLRSKGVTPLIPSTPKEEA